MQRSVGIALLAIGMSIACFAGPSVPELDPSAGGTAIALVAGGLMIIRARRKR